MLVDLIIFAVVFVVLSAMVNVALALAVMKITMSEKFFKYYMKKVYKMMNAINDMEFEDELN